MCTKRISLLAAFCLALAPCLYAQRTTPDFGTTTTSYQRLGPSSFLTGADCALQVTWRSASTLRISGGTGTCDSLIAVANLPGGALLTYAELDYCDTDAIGKHIHVGFYNCDNDGNCDQPALATISSGDGPPGCALASVDLSPLGYTINNKANEFGLVLKFDANEDALQFAGVVLGYQLQVSPPPAQATFNDVPTNHPFFQFIEALYASGITAGCGGGNYCPDNPVTRGQMAVFLAKALGLNWSQ